MKVYKLQVDNYRLLKNFSIDLEDELSLVIGKNNTGKTSILFVLDKFLNGGDRNRILFDDFNIDLKNEIKELIENKEEKSVTEYDRKGIKLKLFIKYDESDDLSNINRVMMDLDPENNVIVLGFEYVLEYDGYKQLRKEYVEFKSKEESKKKEPGNEHYQERSIFDFLKLRYDSTFKLHKKSLGFDKISNVEKESTFIDLDKANIGIKEIINFKYISAKRDVTNKAVDKTLSRQTSDIYKRTDDSDDKSIANERFKDQLSETDNCLSCIYETLFKEVVDKVKTFGGIRLNESEIKIISNLQHCELLEDNTTVVYKHDEDNLLPENYNGLGYMNLISMIFEIEILIQDFKRKKDEKPADINLLFIEEPEAHTHPQMQYVFIKNIKKLLNEGIKRDDGQNRKLQYIISTHSSHVVADSDFDDIKYLKRVTLNSVISKNLKDLKKEYDINTNQYQFLKQYLTISRAEIFFADKTVLIEGDTERILIPTLMSKIDIEKDKRVKESGEKDLFLPLLSQNISVIEVGAYSQIFEKFIDFIGIKTLIITDLDTINKDGEKCEVSVGNDYSNDSIRYFFQSPSLNDLNSFSLKNKLFTKVETGWINNDKGNLCIVYQIKENEYNARSFEDAFININRDFINKNKDSYKSLQNKDRFEDIEETAYTLANVCIKKKTHFALDILFHSNKDFSNWEIPAYINEGLLWLKQD